MIDERGAVRCRVLKAPEGAEGVALEMMEAAQYSPARDALGRPVAVWCTHVINKRWDSPPSTTEGGAQSPAN